MANCAKCIYAKEIDRLRDICLGCSIGKDGCGLSNAGHSVVSLDAASDEKCKHKIERRRVFTSAPAVIETPLGAAERENLLRILYMFSSLSYDEAGTVCSMLAGKSLQQIATDRRQKIQTVHARWKFVCKRNPAWKSLANGMIGSGRGRKLKRKKLKQLDFFDMMKGDD